MCETHSEQINELAKALAAAQGELEPAERNATAAIGEKGRFSRKYADLTAMIDAVRKVLPKHGLSIAQIVLPTEGVAHVRTMLMHESGQWLASECRMPYDNTGSKNAVQSMGSAITYARRYSLSALVGVVADDDDDGEGACRRDRDDGREQPRRNAPEPAPQPKRVDLTALAKELNEVRDGDGCVACWNRHRIPEGHPDYEAVRNMFGKKRKEIEARAETAADTQPDEPPDVPRPTSSIPTILPADQVIAAFNACETVTALRAAADRLAVPENHPDIGAIREAYRTRRKELEAGRTRAA